MGFWNNVLKGVLVFPIIMIVLNLFLIIIPEDIIRTMYNIANYFGSLFLYLLLIFGSLALLIKFVTIMRNNFELIEILKDLFTLNFIKAYDKITTYIFIRGVGGTPRQPY